MKMTFYNPKTKMLYTQEYKNPWYYILKLRCDCFRLQHYNKFGSRFARELIQQGGIEKFSYIVSDSIPFPNNYDNIFASYNDNSFIENWINEHPGENTKPIESFDELNLAISHRHDWDNRNDMYPIISQ